MSEMQLQWEEAPCDWCGSPQTELMFEGPDRFIDLPGIFHLVRCCQCGLIRQNPRLTWNSLKEYYPQQFISYATIINQEPNLFLRWSRRYGMWKKLRLLKRFQRGGRLLDVGCGTGIFLGEVVRDPHWQVMGIEPTEYAANYARQALGVEILQSTLDQVSLPAESFDVITMWDVLEHLPRPIADLRIAHRLLRQGGWLALQVPNVDGLGAHVFGRYWVGWDLPRHLYLFPRATLETILVSTSFRPRAWRCLSASYHTLGESLRFRSQSWSVPHPHLTGAMLKAYDTLFFRAAMLAPLWVLDRLNRSTLITVLAQKV
jgi:2-polyprenyl-3-methyl-5-hydroxy-6-metoxy-1,4-benzoquinol methylase